MSQADKTAARRIRLIDVIGVGLVAYLGFFVWLSLRTPTLSSLLGACVFGYLIFMIVYELTWNRGKVPTIATGYAARKKIADIIKQDYDSKSPASYTIADLGSGHGQLAATLARAMPKASVIGFEMSYFPHFFSSAFQRVIGPKNVSYRRADFLAEDCSALDAVVMYLSAGLTREVGAKLMRELKPGAFVIANEFEMQNGWTPVDTVTFHAPFKTTLYIYRK